MLTWTSATSMSQRERIWRLLLSYAVPIFRWLFLSSLFHSLDLISSSIPHSLDYWIAYKINRYGDCFYFFLNCLHNFRIYYFPYNFWNELICVPKVIVEMLTEMILSLQMSSLACWQPAGEISFGCVVVVALMTLLQLFKTGTTISSWMGGNPWSPTPLWETIYTQPLLWEGTSWSSMVWPLTSCHYSCK